MSKDKVTISYEEPSPLEFIKEEIFSVQLIGCEGDESDDQHKEDCEVNSFDAVSCSLEEEECVLDTFAVKKETGNENRVYFQMKSEEEDAEVKPFEAVFVSKEEDAYVSDNKQRGITNAPWYCRDVNIHRDLKVKTVKEERAVAAKKHVVRLSTHPNCLPSRLLLTAGLQRRLRKTKPTDLML